jgi:hypothetical protein
MQKQGQCARVKSPGNSWIIDAVETARFIPIFQNQIETIEMDQAKMLAGIQGYREYHNSVYKNNVKLDEEYEKIDKYANSIETYFQYQAEKNSMPLDIFMIQIGAPIRPNINWPFPNPEKPVQPFDEFVPSEIPKIENRSETETFADWKHSMIKALKRRREQVSRYPQKVVQRCRALEELVYYKIQAKAAMQEYAARIRGVSERYKLENPDRMYECFGKKALKKKTQQTAIVTAVKKLMPPMKLFP